MKKYTVSEYKSTIEKLKEADFKGFRKYETWRFLYIHIYRYMYVPQYIENNGLVKRFFIYLSLIFKAFARMHLMRYTLSGFSKSGSRSLLYLSDYYNSRTDMQNTMVNLADSIDDVDLIRAEKTVKFSFNPKALFYVLSWFNQLNKMQIDINLKTILLNELVHAFVFEKCIKNYSDDILKADALVSLNDKNTDENLLVQFCRLNGISTAGLQHGHFWNTKNSENLMYLNTDFSCLTADYFFGWGQYSYSLAIKEGPYKDRFVPVGIPKYLERLEKLPVINNKVFGVFFDTIASGAKTNFELAKYADFLSEKFGYKYIVKLHPTDNEERYKGLFGSNFIGFAEPMSVMDFSKKIDFSLICFSTVFFEQVYFNKPSFRYIPNPELDIFEGLTFSSFKDTDELNQLMEYFVNEKENYLNEYRKLSDYCCGAGDIKENYKNAFRMLKSNSSIRRTNNK